MRKDQQTKVKEQTEKKKEKTKEKQTRVRKRVKLVLKTILIITALVFFWRFYSLVRFEGRFTPWYVWGISNPYKYWQEHIGLKLIEHGKRYDLKPTIDENDPTTYNVYQNKKHHFRFKYPKKFYIKNDISFYSDIADLFYVLADKKSPTKCEVILMYTGWGVGKNWLPRKRYSLDKRIVASNQVARYFIAKNGQIIFIDNDFIINKDTTNKQSGISVEFFDKGEDRSVSVRIVGVNCDKVIENILSTFEFTP